MELEIYKAIEKELEELEKENDKKELESLREEKRKKLAKGAVYSKK